MILREENATFSDPHLTVLIPHLTPGPPSGPDVACGVLLYPFPPEVSAPVNLVTGEGRNMAVRDWEEKERDRTERGC